MNGGKTLKDIAEETGIKYSTLRGYAERFSEYIPSYHADGVRWKLYQSPAVEIVTLIAKGYADHKHLYEIRTLLEAAGHHPIIEAETDENVTRDYGELGVSSPISELWQGEDPLTAMHDALLMSMDTLRHYRTLAKYNAELNQEQATLIEILRAEIAHLKAQLEQSDTDEED